MDMPVTHTLAAQRAAIRALLYTNETDVARSLVECLATPDTESTRIVERARKIVALARERQAERGLLEIFLQELDRKSVV